MDEGFPLECAQDANTLRRMKKTDLIELARGYGLEEGGLKETLVQRISEWATRQVWLQTTGQHEAMDHPMPEEPPSLVQQQSQPGPLKRIASTLGFSAFSNQSGSAQSQEISVEAAAAPASPESDYTRRYSFLPEDTVGSVDGDDNESSFGSLDTRPAIRSIPSKLSLDMDRQSQANMLLDDQVDTARASTIFGTNSSAAPHPPWMTMEFGTRAAAEQEFSFQSPSAAPSMPPGQSISSLFQAFMGSNKDKKPDRFAAAHDSQFSKMQSIADSSNKTTQKRKREEENDQSGSKTDTVTSKRSLMSRSIESLRGKAKVAEPGPSKASKRPASVMSGASPEEAARPKKARKSVAMAKSPQPPSKPTQNAAALRRRLLNRQKARRRSSVPGEHRKKTHKSASTSLKASLSASTKSNSRPLPSYAHPTTAFQAKSQNLPNTWTSSLSAKVRNTIPRQPQPPMHPRFGVAQPSKESNGAVIIGFAKPRQSAANGAPATATENDAPRFATGTASSRAKAIESPNKRQRLNTDKPLPVTPGRHTMTRSRARAARPGPSPRKAAISGSLSSRHRPAPTFFPSGY